MSSSTSRRRSAGPWPRRRPLRPSVRALEVTQDRLAERRFLEGAGAAVAPWREVRTKAELAAAADRARLAAPAQGGDRRLRRPQPGPPGRPRRPRSGLARPRTVGEGRRPAARARARLRLRAVGRRRPGRRWPGGAVRGRVATGTTPGSCSRPSSRRPLPVTAAIAEAGRGARRSTWPSALEVVGTLTVEMFLLADGSLVVNELAPRVHNSGHWTIEGAATSQFEQHIRAICGLPLGDPGGARRGRDGQPAGHRRAPRGPARWACRRRSPIRPSTSICTTSARSSSAARWAT